MNAGQLIATTIIEGVAPETLPRSSDEASVRKARALCRAGNPFPLIALQWPSLVVKDPHDAQFFEGAIGHPTNPCLRIDWWQRMLLLGFFDRTIREVFVKGCTGSGKTGIVSIGINLLYDVNDELRLHLTSESFAHCQTNMFGEVKKWRQAMMHPAPGDENTSSIALSARKYIKILNPRPGQGGESFSGAHSAKGSYYFFDEATSAEQTWFDNAYKNAAFVCALANPRTVIGHFRKAFRGLGDKENTNGVCMGVLGKRLCVTVGGMDCVNVKHKRLKHDVAPHGGIDIGDRHYEPGEAIDSEDYKQVAPLIPGQMDINQFRGITETTSESWMIRCFAHGMFPDEDPQSQIILSSWLDRHIGYHSLLGGEIPVTSFGLDVARSLEGDDTSLAVGSDVGCKAVHTFKRDNYPDIADEVYRIAESEYGIDLRTGQNPICIDYGGGYGAGVGDPMHRDGCWVIGNIPGGAALVLPHVYQNQRTEMYGMLGDRLNPKGLFLDPWALPDIPKMVEEFFMTIRTWSSDFTRYRIIPKELIKQQLGRSPDTADSIALLWEAVRYFGDLNEWIAINTQSLVIGGKGGEAKPRGEVYSDLVDHFKRHG